MMKYEVVNESGEVEEIIESEYLVRCPMCGHPLWSSGGADYKYCVKCRVKFIKVRE